MLLQVMSLRMALMALIVAIMMVGIASCLAENQAADGPIERPVRPLLVEFEQRIAVSSSVFRFRLRGTDRLVADKAIIVVRGRTHRDALLNETFDVATRREGDVGDLFVELGVKTTLWPLVDPQPEGRFDGDIAIELHDSLGVLAKGQIEGVAIRFEREFAPAVDSFHVGAVYPNQMVVLSGNNFLRPEEGTTWAYIDRGQIRHASGIARDLSGKRVALVWNGSRTHANLPIDPAIFGVQEVEFEGVFRFENELTSGQRFADDGQTPFAGSILQPFIATLTPDGGSRGQKIQITGRGFVPDHNEGQYGMLLRYEGAIVPADSSRPEIDLRGTNALERVPDRVLREDVIEQSVWYSIQERELVGFGAQPGVFRGRITPILYDDSGEQHGVAWEGEFRVLPTRQVVYLKYLPAFTRGLEKYGLENLERAIRDRILTAVHRDYDGVNIVFVEVPPDDFIDYATIEIGGPDPSGNQAFGYDNTFSGVAKDTGNLYLNDYVGGLNAQSGTEFNILYGGVFIESFSFFSPTLNPHNEFASPEFDRLLGPFMPALGGRPLKATEWPDGERADAAREAVRAVANVIANTISHEIGHTLGLTFHPGDWQEPGQTFHNPVAEGCIMDAGEDRSFEQRAEVGGVEAARFNDRNMQYLRQILPLPID